MGLLTEGADRRSAPRRSLDELQHMTGVKVCSEDVLVLNASHGGMLVEAGMRLNIGTEKAVDIGWLGTSLRLRGRIVRCQVRSLSASGPRYEIAIAFNEPLKVLMDHVAVDRCPASQSFDIHGVELGERDPALSANDW